MPSAASLGWPQKRSLNRPVAIAPISRRREGIGLLEFKIPGTPPGAIESLSRALRYLSILPAGPEVAEGVPTGCGPQTVAEGMESSA